MAKAKAFIRSILFFAAVLLFQAKPLASAGYWQNLGTDFWFALPKVEMPNPTWASRTASVQILAPTGASGVLAIPGLGYSVPFTLLAGASTSMFLPYTAFPTGTPPPALNSNAVHLTSDNPVSAQLLIAPGSFDDGTLLYPVASLGTDYYYLSYGPQGEPCAAIVATEDNTTLQVVPVATDLAFTAGVTVTATLNKGQWYFFVELYGVSTVHPSMSGTRILADKPVTVLAANTGTYIPSSSAAADILLEQAPPVSDWGTDFVAVTIAARTAGDRLRVLASQDGTTVSLNGAPQPPLSAGAWFECSITAHTRIQADKPVFVAHFESSYQMDNLTGDPFLCYLEPVADWSADHVFVAPVLSYGPYASYHISIAVPAGGEAGVSLDGVLLPASAFTAVDTGFSAAQWKTSAGQHRLASVLPCQVEVYGQSNYGSFGMLAGKDVQLTPTPSPTPSISSTITSTWSASPTPSASATATPSPTASATESASPSASPTCSVTLTSTPPPTPTPTPPPLTLIPHSPNPNPANGDEMWLPYTLGTDADLKVEIFTVAGERVRGLPKAWRLKGTHEERWDMRNEAGQRVANGIFICRFQARSPRDEFRQAFVKCAVAR